MNKSLITFLSVIFIIIAAIISQFSDLFFFAVMIFIGLILIISTNFWANNILYGGFFLALIFKPKIKKDSGFYTFNEFFGEKVSKIILRVFGILILLFLIPMYFLS